VKLVVFLAPARSALRKHRSDAERIISKVEAYAANPSGFPKVKTMQGGSGKRLHVGGYRIVFEETADEIIVTDIGPRGSIYG
jgi:mRNA interferase RelE/StbE